MLSAAYLRTIADGAENVAGNLHDSVMRDIVSRMLLRIGQGQDYLMTSTDAWRVKVLQDAGYLLSDIEAEIAKQTTLTLDEVRAAMEDAGVTALENDAAIYRAAGLSPIPLEQSPELIRIMERDMIKTMNTWRNYTGTFARAAQSLFIRECDNAYHRVISGAESYSQAVREAVDAAISDGATVTYPSGRRMSIEAATAMAVRTGVSQATGDICMKRMEEMDWDIILVSAHVGARTGDGGENAGNHHWWQGQFYSRTGTDNRFPPFSVTGYGTGEGLCGWNCRHSFGSGNGRDNPFAELRKTDIEDAGRTEALEQRQRTMERRIRATKRDIMGYETAIENCTDGEARFALQMDMNRKAALLQKQNREYNTFCKENDIRTQSERLQVANWNREHAARAREAAYQYAGGKG